MQGLNANNPFIDVFGALGTICTGMAKYLYHKALNLLRDEKSNGRKCSMCTVDTAWHKWH